MLNPVTALLEAVEQRSLQRRFDGVEKSEIHFIGRLEKWNPAKLDEKFNAEFRLTSYGANPREAAKFALIELAKRGIKPEAVKLSMNGVVNTGLQDYNGGLTGVSAPTVYSNANAKIGVGDSAAAFALSQTDLQAVANAANRRIDAMDATYPTVSNGVATFRSTFLAANANFAWQEWVITNGGAVGSAALTRILNRAVTSLGTKPSSQAWQFTATITLA